MTQEIAQDITPGAAVLAVGNPFFFPAIRACVQEATFKDHLLQANSLTELFTRAGMLLVGGLAKGVGYSNVYLVLGALVLLCALGALAFYTSYQARQTDQREAL